MKKTLIRDGIVVNNGFKSQKDILIEGDIICLLYTSDAADE